MEATDGAAAASGCCDKDSFSSSLGDASNGSSLLSAAAAALKDDDDDAAANRGSCNEEEDASCVAVVVGNASCRCTGISESFGSCRGCRGGCGRRCCCGCTRNNRRFSLCDNWQLQAREIINPSNKK